MTIARSLKYALARRLGLVITIKSCFYDSSVIARAEHRGMTIYVAPPVTVAGRRREDIFLAIMDAEEAVEVWCREHHPRLLTELHDATFRTTMEDGGASQPVRLRLVR